MSRSDYSLFLPRSLARQGWAGLGCPPGPHRHPPPLSKKAPSLFNKTLHIKRKLRGRKPSAQEGEKKMPFYLIIVLGSGASYCISSTKGRRPKQSCQLSHKRCIRISQSAGPLLWAEPTKSSGRRSQGARSPGTIGAFNNDKKKEHAQPRPNNELPLPVFFFVPFLKRRIYISSHSPDM